MEDGNETVSSQPTTELPLNSVVTREQDPELFWMHKYGQSPDESGLDYSAFASYPHDFIFLNVALVNTANH
ncbi:MAG: hypothetical protein IPM98_21115 [Lewinellaceae bacterium]|nr:hypothetical protein [Lewinellaceae bacterium]